MSVVSEIPNQQVSKTGGGAMRLICAWCKVDLADKESSQENPEKISHGICPTCRARFFPDSMNMPKKPERKAHLSEIRP
jgi:ferredoxin